MNFKKGDRVKLSQQGIEEWNLGNDDKTNPANMGGTLLLLRDRHPRNFLYEVRWDNNFENSYKEGDLVLIRPRMEENE